MDRHEDTLLIERIRQLRDHKMPQDIAASVLARLAPKRLPLWRRLLIWFRTPRTLTLRPIQLVPGLVGAMALIWLVASGIFDSGPSVSPMPGAAQVTVAFSLDRPSAESVSLIGTFNHWKPDGYALIPHPSSHIWTLEIGLPPGRHEYAFLVNGKQVVSDPNAAFYKMDGFGTLNSVIFTNFDETQRL